MNRWIVPLTLVAMATASVAFAQSPATSSAALEVPAAGVTQELELMDGSVLIGRVESIGAGHFTFRTSAGIAMTVDAAMVRSIQPVSGRIVEGELWPADANPTRLFFAPTGRSLKKGDAYFGVYEVMLPFVQVGVTDRVSIGGGTPIAWFGGDRPVWVTPKVQIFNGRATAASVGVLHFFNAGGEGGGLGIAYAVVTQGSSDSAASLGVGYAYSRIGDQDGGAPMAMIGGEHRLSRRLKLVTENYIVSGGGFASGGFRLLGDKLSTDFGLVAPLFTDDFILFPVINFVWKF